MAKAQKKLESISGDVAATTQEIEFAEKVRRERGEGGETNEWPLKDVKELEMKSDKLKKNADELNEKTNKIKESDVQVRKREREGEGKEGRGRGMQWFSLQGAYNMTKEAAAKSLEAQRKTDAVVGILAETEKEANEVR